MKSILKSIFRKKKSPQIPGNGDTVPLSDEVNQINTISKLKYDPPQLIASCGQSVGQQRDHNEDSLFACTMTMGGPNGQPLGLYVVADGMGGHQYGEIASTVAARAIAGSLLRKLHPFVANPSETLNESLQEIMHTAIEDAQQAVMKAAPGSGTTVTAALVFGEQVTIAHVGDSRAYTVRPDGHVDVITRDHSLVKRLEELGQISPEEAAMHPQRNVLYRALGQGDELEPDIFTAPLRIPGYLMLCSDGLWGVLTKKEMFQCIIEAPSLQDACQRLIAAANAAGGPDNISVILTQLVM